MPKIKVPVWSVPAESSFLGLQSPFHCVLPGLSLVHVGRDREEARSPVSVLIRALISS